MSKIMTKASLNTFLRVRTEAFGSPFDVISSYSTSHASTHLPLPLECVLGYHL